jgi:hypothetical protein
MGGLIMIYNISKKAFPKSEVLGKPYDIINYIVTTNKHFLIHGFAGSGKSYLINELSKRMRCIKLAPTGLTSLNISGITVDCMIDIYSRVKNDAIEFIEREFDCIIIDEISMIQYYKMDIILSIFEDLEKRNSRVKLAIIGDPFQLPPVVNRNMILAYSEKEGRSLLPVDFYFFKSKLFQEYFCSGKFICLFLSENKRQSDPLFRSALEDIATGCCDNSLFEYLNQRVNVNIDFSSLVSPIVTPTRKSVNYFNTKCFYGTSTKHLKHYPSIDKTDPRNISDAELKEDYNDVLQPVDYGIGAPVVFIQNDKINRWKNGTRGQIKDCDKGYDGCENIHVLSNDGEILHVKPACFNISKLCYDPCSKQVNSEIVARIHRLPFVLAYALTVHKVQGMTLDQLTFNIWSGTFAPGQLYVALSRVKTFEGLYLDTPLRKEHVIVSPEVTEYFDAFKRKCLEAV